MKTPYRNTGRKLCLFCGILFFHRQAGIIVQTNQIKSARNRFAEVMSARKSSRELVGLAEKLLESTKFSEHAKPYCFSDYIAECTARVANGSLDDLLHALKNTWAADHVRKVSKGDGAEQVFGGLVRRVLEVSNKDEVIARRLDILAFAGIIADGEHALRLAKTAGLDSVGEQRVREAMTRIARRPTDPGCPF